MARRANKKFIIRMTIIGVVLAIGLFLAGMWKLVWSKNPLPYVKAGDEAMTAGRYEDAIENYARAIKLKDLDINVWIKLGDAQNFMASADFNNVIKAQQIWEASLAQNPNFVTAHQRLLNHYSDLADAFGGSRRITFLDRAQGAAKNILRITPDDAEAKRVLQQSIIEIWLAGQQVNDPMKITDAIGELRKLQIEQPADPEIPFTIARGLVQQGVEAFRRGEKQETSRLWDEALDVMKQASEANPDDGRFYINYAQVMLGIGPRIDQLGDRDEAKLRQMGAELNKAAAQTAFTGSQSLKPDSPKYLENVVSAANIMLRDMRVAEADALLRKAMEAKPEDLNLRTTLVDMIRGQPGRLDDAVALLTSAPPPSGVLPGVQGQIRRESEQRADLLLSDLKLDQYFAQRESGKPDELAKLMKESEELLAKVMSKEQAETARTLRIRGKVELFKGDPVTAEATLRRALDIAGDQTDRTTLEVKYLLARAYLATDQTGQAERLFRDIVSVLDFTPARIELVRLLLRKGDLTGADTELKVLEAANAGSLEVIGLRMAHVELANKDRTPEEVRKNLDRLPEDTYARQFYKARIAMAAKQYEEAIRIAGLALKAQPGERQLALLIAGCYDALKDKPKAIAFLDDYLKQFPDSPAIAITIERLKGASMDDLRKLGKKELDAIADPLERNLLLFEFYTNSNNREGADAAIAELVKIAPEDKRVVSFRFQHAIQTGNDAEAEKMLELIAKLNIDDAEGRAARARYAGIQAQREPDPFKRATKLQAAIDSAVDLSQARGAYDSVWVILGQAYQASGRFDEAIGAYTQAINRKPQNREALEGLIRCHYAKRNVADTKKIIDQALSIYPNARNFIEYSISWQVEFGNPSEAIAQREKDLKEAPDDPQAHGNLAAVYRAAAESAKDEASRKKFEQQGYEVSKTAVEKFPTNAQLVGLFAELCLAVNRPADGEKAWLTLAADPEMAKSPIIAQRIAGYYRRAKMNDKAVQYCLKYLETDDAPGVRVFLADIYLGMQKVDEATKQLELAGDEPLALKRRTDLLLAAGKGEEAEKLLIDAVNKRPQDTALLNRLAFIYLSRGKLDDSKAAIQKVLNLAPQDPQALFFSAMVRAQEGKVDEAMQIVNRLRELEPDNPDIRKLAAELFRQQGNSAMATSELESVLKSNPDAEETRIQLIETYLSANPQRLGDAERLVQEGMKLGLKDSAKFSHASARVYYAKGDYQQALDALKESIKTNANDLAMQDTYFRIMMAAKQYDSVISTSSALLEQVKQPWIYSTRGSAYARLKQSDKAMADFESGYQLANESGDDFAQENVIRAMFGEIGPEQAVKFLTVRAKETDLMRIFLAQVYTLTRKFDDALTLARDVYPRREQLGEKQRMSFLKLTGAVALSVNPPDMQLARQAYEEYLAKSPRDFQVMNNLACLLLMPGSGGTPAEAEEWARKAVAEMDKINRRDALVLDTLGAAMTAGGKLDEAILVLREATTIRDFPDVFVHLGDALLRKGELTAGAAELDRAQLLIDNAKKANSASPNDLELERKIGELRLKAGSGAN